MTYKGGKNGSGVYQKIINLMPPHQIYAEPFVGGGAIFRLKRPAPVANIAIDKDAAVIAQLEKIILQDERIYPELHTLVWDAFEFLEGWKFTERWFTPQTLIYMDPPYLLETRSSKRPLYKFEMTDDDHIRLLTIAKELPCMVMISGYYSDLYASMLHNWRSVSFTAQTRRGPATEWVWLNFPEPFELHDYRYLGDTYRERERIHKRQRRWKAKLAAMEPMERFSILSVIDDLARATPTINGGVGQQHQE